MTTLKTTDRLPTWKAETAWERVIGARIMLYQHGFMSEAERRRIDKRINAWHAKHAPQTLPGDGRL